MTSQQKSQEDLLHCLLLDAVKVPFIWHYWEKKRKKKKKLYFKWISLSYTLFTSVPSTGEITELVFTCKFARCFQSWFLEYLKRKTILSRMFNKVSFYSIKGPIRWYVAKALVFAVEELHEKKLLKDQNNLVSGTMNI